MEHNQTQGYQWEAIDMTDILTLISSRRTCETYSCKVFSEKCLWTREDKKFMLQVRYITRAGRQNAVLYMVRNVERD